MRLVSRKLLPLEVNVHQEQGITRNLDKKTVGSCPQGLEERILVIETNTPKLFPCISGMGAVTPLGVGIKNMTLRLRNGRGAFELLTTPTGMQWTVARCNEFDPLSVMDSAETRRLSRVVPMAIAAVKQAMLAANLDLNPETASRVGVILGTGGGGIDFTVEQLAHLHAGRRQSLWALTNATHGNLAGEISIAVGAKGPSLCVSNGCASSSDAVGLASDLLASTRIGTPDAWIVVGADAHVCPEVLQAMDLLGVLSSRKFDGSPDHVHSACRPFDRTRDGMVLAEGAWAIVLERESFSRERRAPRFGRVLGYGSTCDAFHRVRPDPAMTESARAIHMALHDARLSPERVQVVHYHGTGTQLNDAAETRAIKAAFGSHAKALKGSSVKSMIGHPQGACGLAALVSTVSSLRGMDGGPGFVLPTANLQEPDEACDLDYTPQFAAESEAKVALINCLAFGSKNSALIVEVE